MPRSVVFPPDDVLGPVAASGQLAPGMQAVNVAFRQSPYPTAQEAEVFERLHPGAFGRILAMTEKGQKAAIDASAVAQDYQRDDTRRGHWLGASLTVLAIAVGAAVGIWGNPIVAVAILGVPVFTAISRFVDSVRGK